MLECVNASCPTSEADGVKVLFKSMGIPQTIEASFGLEPKRIKPRGLIFGDHYYLLANMQAMAVETVLHMNTGDGETSYANNSTLQKNVIQKAKPVLDGTLKDMYNNNFPKCFKIADLGCSSGPNTLLVISEIIDTIHGLCQQNKNKEPEFQLFLNDLPQNDFNTIFKSLPTFYEKLKKEKGDMFGPCFVCGVAGSFYRRLFVSKSLHLVHSSYSVHWLSQVPERLESNNKGNIYMSKSSPPGVYEAYLMQFQRDFSTFLRLRSEEIIPGGRMVLTFIGRGIADPTTNDFCDIWQLIANSLLEMVAEGLVKEDDLDSFNLPLYTPYKDEVKAVIQKEGSFNLDKLEEFEVNYMDASEESDDFVFDKYRSGKIVAGCIRSVSEPMLASHFGHSMMDNLFTKYSNKVAEHLPMGITKYSNIVISLTNK